MSDDYNLVFTALLIASCCVLLSACETATPERVHESFGNSVRNMIDEQTYKPGDPVPELDGDRSREVLHTYRREGSDRSLDQ